MIRRRIHAELAVRRDVIHMPIGYTELYARTLNEKSALDRARIARRRDRHQGHSIWPRRAGI